MMEPVRVAVHAADPLTRSGLFSGLQGSPEIRVIPDGGVAPVDVTLVVVDTVNRHTLALLRSIQKRNGGRMVLVTDHVPSVDMMAMVECGVAGLFARTGATGERLAAAALAVHSGRAYLPSDLLGTLLEQVARLHREVLEPNGLNTAGLVPREVDVLRLMADGLHTAEIAKRLSYSERTVKNIVHGVMRRLNLRNRSHAVAYAMRNGVI